MSQTTAPANAMTVAVAGQSYQVDYPSVIDSGFNEEASNPMAFGLIVARGTVRDGYIQPAGATDAAKANGVLMHSHAYARSTDGTTVTGDLISTGVLPDGKLNVVRKGRLYVTTEQELAVGDTTLRVRHTAGAGGTAIGAIRKDAVANETLSLGRAAICVVAGSAGGLAVIEFDFSVALGTADT